MSVYANIYISTSEISKFFCLFLYKIFYELDVSLTLVKDYLFFLYILLNLRIIFNIIYIIYNANKKNKQLKMKNTFLKVFLKKNIKYISKLYYDFVPKKIKQNIHKYVSSESLKQNLDTNLFTTIFFEQIKMH